MPTLTNSATFSVGAGSPAVEDLTLTVLPPAPVGQGKGRLVHPTLGTLDYAEEPTHWTNIDGDVIAAPIWASTKTLRGSANTLWPGDIRDVTCIERWGTDGGEMRMSMAMLRSLILFYLNPPDPAAAAVIWRPTYTSALAFQVAMVNLTVDGQGVTLDWFTRQGWTRGDVELSLKILGRA